MNIVLSVGDFRYGRSVLITSYDDFFRHIAVSGQNVSHPSTLFFFFFRFKVHS